MPKRDGPTFVDPKPLPAELRLRFPNSEARRTFAKWLLDVDRPFIITDDRTVAEAGDRLRTADYSMLTLRPKE